MAIPIDKNKKRCKDKTTKCRKVGIYVVKKQPRIIAALLLLVSCLAVAESESQLIKPITGEITVDANGVVKSVNLIYFNDEKLETSILEKIKAWEFLPINVNNSPVEVTTRFTVNLLATIDKDDKLTKLEFNNLAIQPSDIEYQERINLEENKKDGTKRGYRSFVYPKLALRIGVEATVILAVDVSEEGNVKNAEIFSIELIKAHPKDSKTLAKDFGKNAVLGIQEQEFSKNQLVSAGCENGCIAKSTVVFKIPPNFNAAPGVNWKSYIKIQSSENPWKDDDGKIDLSAGQSQLVRLKKDPTAEPIIDNGKVL
jgi:hypothetical protein